MRNRLHYLLAALFAFGCAPDPEPLVEPPQPVWVASSAITSAQEHGIFADVDPSQNAIWLEWHSDPSEKTSGYEVYRSSDSTTDNTGLLVNRIQLAHLEPPNRLFERLDTSFRDTRDIITGKKYWYQIQAFNRSATNRVSLSHPTPITDSATYRVLGRSIPLFPTSQVKLETPFTFHWNDPEAAGSYQVILERVDVQEVVWVSEPIVENVTTQVTVDYPASAKPLVSGAKYRWRVKKLGLYSGSSSIWQDFSIE
jgi:hypothetical protein